MELKERIISSAYELFSTKGYEKTTIEAIIKKAQCAKGGFYHHFKSKEEILEVIISNYIDELTMYFRNIALDDEDRFIDKFNAIFVAISQYKLKQLTEWSKVNNIFIFQGNERILRQLTKQFKFATTRKYLEVINKGKAQGIISFEHPEILAEFCAREIIWTFEAISRAVYSEDINEQNMLGNLMDFSEDVIGHALGLNKNEVKFKEVAISHLQSAKQSYLENKEG